MMASVFSKRSRVPELDGFRGLAIGLVLYAHYGPRAVIGPEWLARLFALTEPLGGFGVTLFFVLSGFLIGGILMDHRRAGNYFQTFYRRRCCRILPVYFATVGLYVAVKSLLSAHAAEGWFGELFLRGAMPVWANLTFTQNFVQVLTLHANPDWLIVNWSLVLEEQFYLLLPLALWLMRPWPLVRILFVLLCAHPLIHLFLCIFHPVAYVRANGIYPMPADALVIGVIGAFAVRQGGFAAWLAANRALARATLALLVAGAVCVVPLSGRSQWEYETILLFSPWLNVFAAALLLAALLDAGNPLAVFLRLRPMRWLGTISYGVYLFHLPVNGLMHGLILGRDYRYREWPDVLVSAAALAATLLLATLSWHFFEKPIVAWGHSFGYEDDRSAKT